VHSDLSHSDLSLDQLRPATKLLVVVVLMLPLVLLSLLGMEADGDEGLAGVIFAAYAVLCMPLLLKRKFYLVEPYSVIFLILYLGVPLKLAWSMNARHSEQMVDQMLGDSISTLVQPSVIVSCGLFGLVVGYMMGLPVLLRRAGKRVQECSWNQRSLFLLCGLLTTVSVLGFAFFASRTGISFSGNGPLSAKRIGDSTSGMAERSNSLAYLRWAISLSQIAFYFLFAWALRQRLNATRMFTVLCVIIVPVSISFLMPFVTSSRTPLVFFLVECLVLLYCLKERVFTGSLLTFQLLAVGVVISLFMGILALRRSSNETDVGRHRGSVVLLIDHVVGGRYLSDITKTAKIYEAFPDQLDFQHGKSYLTLLAAPVPRQWWSDKPMIGLGPYIGSEVYGMKASGVPPGMFGEAYLNFGLAGIFFVPFIYGFAIRCSFETLRPRLRMPTQAIIYAVFFRFYVGVLGIEFTVGVIQFLTELIPVVFILWCIQARGGRLVAVSSSPSIPSLRMGDSFQ
jgi:oligosaccharide repeat unit polymerase